jgi:hypothetical protein
LPPLLGGLGAFRRLRRSPVAGSSSNRPPSPWDGGGIPGNPPLERKGDRSSQKPKIFRKWHTPFRKIFGSSPLNPFWHSFAPLRRKGLLAGSVGNCPPGPLPWNWLPRCARALLKRAGKRETPVVSEDCPVTRALLAVRDRPGVKACLLAETCPQARTSCCSKTSCWGNSFHRAWN